MINPYESYLLIVCFLFQLFYATGFCAEKPTPNEYLPQLSSQPIETLDYPNLVDIKRNRTVPIKLHIPVNGGPYPLAIFSHGGGGDRDSHIYQARFLAHHGYAVFCVEHTGSNTQALKNSMRRKRQGTKDALAAMVVDSGILINRPLDITFCINQAEAWAKKDSSLHNRINTTRIAVVGHSYGAYTVLATCGARLRTDRIRPTIPSENSLASDLSDSRITFGFAMSPQAPGEARFSTKSFSGIHCPLVFVSGDKDESNYRDHPGTRELLPPEARKETYRLVTAEKHLFWLKNADHLCFADSPGIRRLERILPCVAREDAQRITKSLLVTFCRYYLDNDKAALNVLNVQGLRKLRGKIIDDIEWMHALK